VLQEVCPLEELGTALLAHTGLLAAPAPALVTTVSILSCAVPRDA
jgi:hypothetical protein